jgi:hypothetical protein
VAGGWVERGEDSVLKLTPVGTEVHAVLLERIQATPSSASPGWPPRAAATSHRAVCLAVAVVVALLVGGCADQAADSPADAAPKTTSSIIATTTTIPPLATEELAWLDALTKMKETFEKQFTKAARCHACGSFMPVVTARAYP